MKLSGVIGPFFFSLITTITGNSRYGMLVITIFFVIGFILLMFVNVKSGSLVAIEFDISNNSIENNHNIKSNLTINTDTNNDTIKIIEENIKSIDKKIEINEKKIKTSEEKIKTLSNGESN
jgi:hypothetical protein